MWDIQNDHQNKLADVALGGENGKRLKLLFGRAGAGTQASIVIFLSS